MKKNKKYQHGFVGCGKMAGIILRVLLENQRVKPRDVLVSRRNNLELKKIARDLRVVTTIHNSEVTASSQIVWLGVKPFQAREVLDEIKADLKRGTPIVSMLAGISTGTIRRYLGRTHPVLRIMPNTPSALGWGVTGAYFTPEFPVQLKGRLIGLLRDLGEVVLLKNEKQFDAVTGLSGSGPAFVYAIAEGMIAGGRREKLSSVQAKALAVQTLLGAAAMLKKKSSDPRELIAQVVSKGGTTEAGLKVLKKFRVAEGMEQAVRAAARRSREIGRRLK